MNRIKNSCLFKTISLVLIFTFVVLDISYAYPPEHNTSNSTLAIPSVLQQTPINENAARFQQSVFSQGALLASVYDIAEYSFGNTYKGIGALPSKYAKDAIETNLEKHLNNSNTQILNIVPVEYIKKTSPAKLKSALDEIGFKGTLPDEGVVFILYRKDNKRFLVQIARTGEVSAANLPGYEWVVSDKYVVKYIPEDYLAEQPKPAVETKEAPKATITEPVAEVAVLQAVSKEEKPAVQKRTFTIRAIARTVLIMLFPLLISFGALFAQERSYGYPTAVTMESPGRNERVRTLIRALKDDREYIREKAARELSEIGQPAIPILASELGYEWLLEYRDPLSTEATADGYDYSKRTQKLIRELKYGEPYIREKAAKELSEIGQPAVYALIRALRYEGSPEYREPLRYREPLEYKESSKYKKSYVYEYDPPEVKIIDGVSYNIATPYSGKITVLDFAIWIILGTIFVVCCNVDPFADERIHPPKPFQVPIDPIKAAEYYNKDNIFASQAMYKANEEGVANLKTFLKQDNQLIPIRLNVPGAGDRVFELDIKLIAASRKRGIDIRKLINEAIGKSIKIRGPNAFAGIKDAPITITLLDKSRSIFEDHKQNSFIGINRIIFDKAQNKTHLTSLKTLLKVGITHELRHEAGEYDEAMLSEEDARLTYELVNKNYNTIFLIASLLNPVSISGLYMRELMRNARSGFAIPGAEFSVMKDLVKAIKPLMELSNGNSAFPQLHNKTLDPVFSVIKYFIRVVKPLIRLSNDDDPSICFRAMMALTSIFSVMKDFILTIKPLIGSSLESNSASIRLQAARTLDEMKDQQAAQFGYFIEPLIRLLGDDDLSLIHI